MSNWIIKPEDLINFCSSALENVGVKKTEAQIAAEIMTRADMRGVSSHGTASLKIFIDRIQNGGINPKADIEVVSEGPSWALVDGHSGMGQLTAYKATKMAIEKAKNSGIAMIGVRNGMHFGAAAYYTMMIAERDMIGISMSNVNINMSITGSAGRVIGNNPFSYATPAGKEKPVVFDVAMSVTAGSKINNAAKEGKNVSLGLIIDKNGNPTKNPRDYLDGGGALLPFADHKGYGFALMVEILAAVITGNALTKDIAGWDKNIKDLSPEGFNFIAINIDSFMPIEDYKTRMDTLIRQVKNSPRAKGIKRIYLPGEIEHEKEEHSIANGIVLSKTTLKSLKSLAEDFKIEDKFSSLITEVGE